MFTRSYVNTSGNLGEREICRMSSVSTQVRVLEKCLNNYICKYRKMFSGSFTSSINRLTLVSELKNLPKIWGKTSKYLRFSGGHCRVLIALRQHGCQPITVRAQLNLLPVVL